MGKKGFPVLPRDSSPPSAEAMLNDDAPLPCPPCPPLRVGIKESLSEEVGNLGSEGTGMAEEAMRTEMGK